MIGNAPNSLVVNPSFPAKTLAELIAYAKANPARSIRLGRRRHRSHITGEYFARTAGITLVHIPTRARAALTISWAATSRWRSRRSRLPRQCRRRQAARAGGDQTARSSLLPTCDGRGSGTPGFDASLYYGLAAPAARRGDHRQAQQGVARCARLR